MANAADEFDLLLPMPRRIERSAGRCVAGSGVSMEVRCEDKRLHKAYQSWLDRAISNGVMLPRSLSVGVDPGVMSQRDGYRLKVSSDRIELIGASTAGCFHGLQTLRQFVEPTVGASKADGPRPAAPPCCTIEDWPDFPVRGLLHDVTRGKVPTIGTLKRLVNRLATLKGNQLQLYIEHAFVFSFDADICGPDEGLTPEEIRELDAYCRDRYIDLVPAVATLGHMGKILSLPKYRRLAEIAPEQEWADLTWPQRARGFTLDCTNPDSHRLVERIWSEILDAFSGPVVNICGDEPWDLGKGRNAERFREGGKEEAYVAHLLRTHEYCSRRGRSTQFWSDVIRRHEHLIDPSMKESTILHWGYDDHTDYEGTAALVSTGMPVFVCPGTTGWKRALNAMNLAERNIATFAAAGWRHGATGLLNTDWGDHGHFNGLACSWHGAALGACLGWRSDHVTGDAFDERFARSVLGLRDVEGVRRLRATSALADSCETWRMLWSPLASLIEDRTLPPRERLEESIAAAESAREWWSDVENLKGCERIDGRELELACRFHRFATEKMRMVKELQGDGRVSSNSLQLTSEAMENAVEEYREAWSARNKRSGIDDIESALSRVAGEFQQTR